MDTNKQKIIDLFNKNVRNKRSDVSNSNTHHDGKEGHWLERQMGLSANASNKADLFGYEMKNNTTSKTTFGDWSPDIALYKGTLNRDTEFLVYFGKPNAKKNGRYSWSGTPVPKISRYNDFGQILKIDNNSNICAVYSFSKDLRPDKSQFIPANYQVDDLVIAQWTNSIIKKKLENKFNQNGWFKCKKNNSGVYHKIVFGDPINFENWLSLVKKGIVFFDSGMYAGNLRPYAQWRANNSVWDELITSEY